MEAPIKGQLGNKLLGIVNNYLAKQNVSAEDMLPELEIEHPKDPLHGDFSISIALKLSKQIGKPPNVIAEEIKADIPPLEYIEKVDIAAPGFINFHLADSYLQKQLEKILTQKDDYGRLKTGNGKKVLVEYSQPNIAKPLGAHHLLSTIIGQVIADLYRYGGYDVVSLNYLGDWGTQFGKLIHAYKAWGVEDIVKRDPLNELLKLYVKFHDEVEKKPDLVDKGRAEFKKLEEGDEENVKLLEWIRELSIKEIKRIYKILGVEFDEYLGESMYLDRAKELVQEGKDKGIFVTGERGAIIAKFENDKYPPFMVQKADGTTLYSTRDIATLEDRLNRYDPQKILYVVDVAQSLHFNQLFDTAKRMGYNSSELVHVSFGRMQLAEGSMSTRKGDVILLDKVISEGVTRSQRLVDEKGHDLSEEEKKDIAEKMAVSAIKYSIISQNRETNIKFDWDKILSLEGNSGPYLEYAYARSQSILRKAGTTAEPQEQATLFNESSSKQGTQHPIEKSLLRLLIRFPDRIQESINTYKPHILTTYLFDLARAFNSFYSEVPVLNAETKELKTARLKLVDATGQVLKNGLQLLGIAVFEKM